jgi:ubiquinone/menaquinone biosynthesis C-methylase UbiE
MSNASSFNFDKYAGRYQQDLTASIPASLAEGDYFAKYKVRHVSRRMLSQEVKNFLDFGCGIGYSLSAASHEFPNAELWGYDVSKECIALARERTGMARLTNKIEELPSFNFEVVFIANVFHHVPVSERITVLKQCRNLLRKNGRIFLFEHNPLNPLTRCVFDRCPFDKGAVMLHKRDTLALARDAGLRTIRYDYTLFFPRQLWFLRPFEPLLRWLPLGAQYCVEMTA